MRILHVIPSLNWGSAERQLQILLRELPSSQFEQQLLVLRGAIPGNLPTGVRGIALNLGPRVNLAGLMRLRRSIKMATPDVLHAWRLEACRLGSLAGRLLPMRRLASVWQPPVSSRWFSTMANGAALRSMSACMTPRWAESNAWYADSGFQSVGYAAVPPSSTSASSRAKCRTRLAERLGIPADAPLVGFVGPWLRENRIKDVIWAADLLKVVRDDVHVLVGGYGPMRGRLRRFRKQVRIEDRVHFVSDPAMMDSSLGALDCVWVTSQTCAGMPTLLEAMSRGIPVIATDQSCHRRYITDGHSGLIVNVGHRAGFARQTLRLLDDPGFAQQLGVAGQDSIARRCAVSSVVEEYTSLYNKYGP